MCKVSGSIDLILPCLKLRERFSLNILSSSKNYLQPPLIFKCMSEENIFFDLVVAIDCLVIKAAEAPRCKGPAPLQPPSLLSFIVEPVLKIATEMHTFLLGKVPGHLRKYVLAKVEAGGSHLPSPRHCAACQVMTQINFLITFKSSQEFYLIPLSDSYILPREFLVRVVGFVSVPRLGWAGHL